MSRNSSPATRRSVLAASAALGAVSLLPIHLAAAGEARSSARLKQRDSQMASKPETIRPFTFHAPQHKLDELRRRVATTQ
jgi:hypothetical protein